MPDAFDLDAFTSGLTLAPFRFTLGGKERELPHFQKLSIQQGLDIEQGHIREVLTEVSDDELADLIVNLPGKASNELLDRWQRAAGVTQGESRASSRS